jgi:hypothetical protein
VPATGQTSAFSFLLESVMVLMAFWRRLRLSPSWRLLVA